MKKTIFIFLLIFLSFLSLPVSESVEIESEDIPVKEENNHILGKIKIPDTSIDYYLVQASDNKYYLTHNYLNQEEKTGSIFLDYRNKLDDKKLLVYGHNSKDGIAPFHELINYLDEEYYAKHKKLILTLNEKSYNYEIFSIILVDKNNNFHTRLEFNRADYLKHLNYLKNNSIYKSNIKLNNNNRIIMLQTCNYEPNETYLLVTARRVYEENI